MGATLRVCGVLAIAVVTAAAFAAWAGAAPPGASQCSVSGTLGGAKVSASTSGSWCGKTNHLRVRRVISSFFDDVVDVTPPGTLRVNPSSTGGVRIEFSRVAPAASATVDIDGGGGQLAPLAPQCSLLGAGGQVELYGTGEFCHGGSVEKIKFKQEFGPTQANKRNAIAVCSHCSAGGKGTDAVVVDVSVTAADGSVSVGRVGLLPQLAGTAAAPLTCAAQGPFGNAKLSLTAGGAFCETAADGTVQVSEAALARAALRRLKPGATQFGTAKIAPMNGGVEIALTDPDGSTATADILVPPPGSAGGSTGGAPGFQPACSSSALGGQVESSGDGIFCLLRLRKRPELLFSNRTLLQAIVAGAEGTRKRGGRMGNAQSNPLYRDNREGVNPLFEGKSDLRVDGCNPCGTHKDGWNVTVVYTAPDGTVSHAEVLLLPAV